MPTYEELKGELRSLSPIIESFPPEVQTRVFDLLIQRFYEKDHSHPERLKGKPSKVQSADNNNKMSSLAKPKAKGKSSSELPKLNRDLDLSRVNGNPSFREFYDEKKPKTGPQFNTLLVYYLKRILEREIVTLDDAYTCYREVGQRAPVNFRQAFIDTKNKNGWVDIDKDGNLSIPLRGINLIEHDLPAKKGSE